MVDYKEFYAKTKGDFFRMSKEADKYFTRSDGGFALFWINSPSPHKILARRLPSSYRNSPCKMERYN